MFQVRESNMTYVEPSSQHPSAVLVDLQHLDVVNCESEAHRRQDERCSNPGLSRQGATEGLIMIAPTLAITAKKTTMYPLTR
jgi:hypothetical protein